MVAPADITRLRGHASLVVEVVAGSSAVTSARALEPMKLLTPRARGESVWGYTSSFGGGLVAGDETQLEIRLGAGARCFLGTQASTKIYRNPGALPCGHVTRATLEEGSLLVFAPDPVQPFAGSNYLQRQEFHLASGAGLVLLDWFSAGRVARGERWAFSRLQSRNEVWSLPGIWTATDPGSAGHSNFATESGRALPQSKTLTRQPGPFFHSRAKVASPVSHSFRTSEGNGDKCHTHGELRFLDSLRMDAGDAGLANEHRTGRFNCFAMLLFLGPPLKAVAGRLLEDLSGREVARGASLITSASPIRDGALLRVAGESVEQAGRQLQQHLEPLANLLGDDPWARKW